MGCWHDVADFGSTTHAKPPVFGRKEGGCEPVAGHADESLPGAFDEAVLVLAMGWSSFDGDLLVVEVGGDGASDELLVEVGANELGCDLAIFNEFLEIFGFVCEVQVEFSYRYKSLED